MSVNTEDRKAYFTEVAIALRRMGYEVERVSDEHLKISLDSHPLCEVKEIAGITYRQENLSTAELESAKDSVYQIVSTVAEYVRQMRHAPLMNICGLENYRVLADFNGTVLAGMNSKNGAQFVTWDWDFDRSGVSHGHYYNNNYAAAKQDFAIRSRLIPEERIFNEEQLVVIYRSCEGALNYGLDMSNEQEKCLRGVQEQIEYTIPNIAEIIKEQDMNGADFSTQKQTM